MVLIENIKSRILKSILLFVFMLLSLVSISQTIPNLISNYSFEEFNICPSLPDNVKDAKFWFKATVPGTSDYFNSCATNSIASVPNNINGIQSAKTGDAYSGIATYVKPYSNAREYIGNGLKQNLIINKTYCVTFFINLSDKVRMGANNMGFVFSNDSIREYTPVWPPYTLTNTPTYESNTVVIDTVNWTQIQTSYLANGTERFITIGNFRNDAATTFTPTKPFVSGNGYNVAYYFIDDVSVVEIVNANASIKDSLTSRCVSDSVVLGTDSTWDATYTWSSTATGLSALSCTNCPNPIAKPAITTKYYLTKQQCSATTRDSVTVVVLTPTTNANAGNDKTICIGEYTQIGTSDSLAFTNYTWQSSASLSCSNCAMPFAFPNVTTTYTVQRTECANVTTDTVKIIIDDCDPTFVLPNVFTPNFDGINDTWGVNFSTVNSHITSFKMSIYNRWGLLVYSTNYELSTPNSKWDGRTTAGIECKEGVYFYVITFDKNEEEQKLSGHVSLFR